MKDKNTRHHNFKFDRDFLNLVIRETSLFVFLHNITCTSYSIFFITNTIYTCARKKKTEKKKMPRSFTHFPFQLVRKENLRLRTSSYPAKLTVRNITISIGANKNTGFVLNDEENILNHKEKQRSTLFLP